MTAEPNFYDVRVTSIRFEAEGIHSFELKPTQGMELPPFTAGAHIELHLSNGMQRSYSLLNNPAERHRYMIAISRDPKSRGGSRFIHDKLQVGQTVRISAPRNNFELDESALNTVLISGGIGITPLMSMIERLEQLKKPWHLFYCARSRQHAAFLEQLTERGFLDAQKLTVHLDDEAGRIVDLGAIIGSVAPGTHLYCCGPTPMLDGFIKAAEARPSNEVHVEYFTAKEAPALEGGFKVILRKTGREVAVAKGETILQTLLDAGIEVPYSCMEGICGACETKVIEGTPDHRDVVLTEAERQASKTMMICCSGCKSERLVLDL
jgi:vanillate O-demethylase ferredoxin subunit